MPRCFSPHFTLSTSSTRSPRRMGNDGGSIARRDELVKVKATTNSKSQAKSTQRQKWTTCALSKQPLREPVVADALGRMYNKEAVTEWLIESVTGGARDESAEMNHIKGLKVRRATKRTRYTHMPCHICDADHCRATPLLFCRTLQRSS